LIAKSKWKFRLSVRAGGAGPAAHGDSVADQLVIAVRRNAAQVKPLARRPPPAGAADIVVKL
jgi:hypothetical protein